MTNNHVGSTFASFLRSEGIQAKVYDLAKKRVLAWRKDQEACRKSEHKLVGTDCNEDARAMIVPISAPPSSDPR